MSLGLAAPGCGCGFHPLYGQYGSRRAALSAVYVNIIPNRSGQLLRQALQARLEGTDDAVAKRYTLSVGFGLVNQLVGVQNDNSVSRVRDVGTATWTLFPLGEPTNTIATGTARSVDGYNVFDAQLFYQDLSEQETEHRLAEALADQILIGLTVYFDKHPDKA
jgi:LPS-assembly lipoprotein